ncbi:MAG: hypothetical protein IJ191_03960 [Treponema sp.]|nr:hypothetical protein [Treponema sp.]
MAEEKKAEGASATMSADLAEQEFNDWAESMGLEVTDESRSETDETVFSNGKKLFIRALSKGNAVVDDNGDFVYTVSKFSPEGYKGTDVKITLPPPRSLVAGGKKGNESGMQRVLSVASGMTGKDTGWFLNLALPDFKFFMGIAGLFLID